jgi:hypothetical protein
MIVAKREKIMRRLLTFVFSLLLLGAPVAPAVAQTPTNQQQQQTKEQTVYITRTGKKYHTANCRYLSHSKIPVSLKDAQANGYTRCSVCHPPR